MPMPARRSRSVESLVDAGARRSGALGLLNDALRVTRAGNPLSSIGAAVERAVSEHGYGVCETSPDTGSAAASTNRRRSTTSTTG